MPTAENVMTNLLACAVIRIDGTRPWDIRVHDRHFFNRVLASGTLGFGESYMDGWWDCDALDEMCCCAIHAGLENRAVCRSFRFSFRNKIPALRCKHACL